MHMGYDTRRFETAGDPRQLEGREHWTFLHFYHFCSGLCLERGRFTFQISFTPFFYLNVLFFAFSFCLMSEMLDA